ncbi:O-antigen ligase family protein [Paenibacillus harenae]|uniref:O-antigen ligase family protein n=1 Tax=Paenibacillus harenae TaxID=306543 RepID=UPI0004241DA3|nr:O-antigen ligase family protein [Paenibacillus harenae]
MANRMAFILLTIFFGIGAFWQGYFTETAFLVSNLCLFIGLIVILCLKREWVFSITHLFILLFVAGYWIAVLYAADVEQAVLEAERVTGLLPLSLLVAMIPQAQLTRLYQMWPKIGALLTIAGILFGMERNGRLESTLEYANALAIFLLVNILVCLFSFLEERRLVHVVLMSINAVGLLLTFSRSVWVLWLVMICLAAIWFAELRKRSLWVPIGLAHLSGLGIALLIKGDGLFFWQRVSSIQSKTSEFQIRLVYWKDSIGMIRDYWRGGTGGGGWSLLVHQYQSQDYFVRFLHNHFVQVAVDLGVFGLLLFAGWLGIYYWTAIRRVRKSIDETALWTKGAILLVTAMLLHAGFDFDLTFPFLFGVLACLTVPWGGKMYTARLPGRILGLVLPAAAAVVCLSGWLAVGYGGYWTANSYVKEERFVEAQATFAKAERLLPWSSTVLYGSAKGYVKQGNETGESFYYRLAEKKLRQAHEMLPDQVLYMNLLNQINAISTNKD